MKKPNTKLSYRALAKQTGADRASIAKWCEGITDEKEALAAIREHQAARKAKPSTVDPETGLTWFQAKMREDTITKRMENEERRETQARNWIGIETHHRILRELVNRIEQLPGKARSVCGLTEAQATAIRRMLDEARTEAANAIREMK